MKHFYNKPKKPEEMIEILEKTIEYENFGLNALTISAIATIIFSLVKGYGIGRQAWKIWSEKSGESISPIFFAYNFFYFLIFLAYGFEEKSLAIIISGSLCLLYLPILIGLKKFRGFTSLDIAVTAVMAMAIPTLFFFDKEKIVSSFSLLAIIAILSQVKEVWKKKDFGAFSVVYLYTFLINSSFWCIYYTATKSWFLGSLSIMEVLFISASLIIERKWKKERKAFKN